MATLQLPDPPPRRRMSLRDIAEYRGVTVEQTVAVMYQAIAEFRDMRGPDQADKTKEQPDR